MPVMLRANFPLSLPYLCFCHPLYAVQPQKKRGGGGGRETGAEILFLCSTINAEIMVTNQLRIVQFSRNDQ